MRSFHTLAFAMLLSWAVTPFTAARAQQADRISVCASPAAALQAAQTGAAAMPDGCHIVLVRRVDTPAGPVCQVDFSPNVRGFPGALVASMVPMQWWIACSYLRMPAQMAPVTAASARGQPERP